MKLAAKVTSKGQVTIPKRVRDDLGLQDGDYLIFETKGDRALLTKAPVKPTDDFDRLADRVAERFKDRGITRSEVAEAMRWARRKS